MIGRGVFDNLFLFNRDVTPLKERSPKEKLELMLKHIDTFEATWGEQKPYRILKKYFKIYASNFSGASQLRMKLVETESSAEAHELVRSFLAPIEFQEVA